MVYCNQADEAFTKKGESLWPVKEKLSKERKILDGKG